MTLLGHGPITDNSENIKELDGADGLSEESVEEELKEVLDKEIEEQVARYCSGVDYKDILKF